MRVQDALFRYVIFSTPLSTKVDIDIIHMRYNRPGISLCSCLQEVIKNWAMGRPGSEASVCPCS